LKWLKKKEEEAEKAKKAGGNEAGYGQKSEIQTTDKFSDMEDHIRPWLMGKVAGAVFDVKPAKEIIDEMVTEAVDLLRQGNRLIQPAARANL